MKKLEILGPGCARCRQTEEEIRKALNSLGLTEKSEYHSLLICRRKSAALLGLF